VIYALVITIAVGILLLLLLGGGALFAQRAAGGEVTLPALGRWRWHPSPLGLLVLLPLAAIVLWRFFPAFLFIPFVLPFFWRGRRTGGPFSFVWRRGPPNAPSNGRKRQDESTIEGQYRPLDEE
jgi:hypothetical protein